MILSYSLQGQGPHKVIMLHDWFSDCTSYHPCLPYLNTHDFQYAFFDLRGYGNSREHPGDYTAQEAAQDILDTADKLGWKKFHLVGHSMTGLVGQLVCALAQDHVLSFTAVCPVTAVGMPEAPQEAITFMKTAAQEDDTLAAQVIHMMTSNRHGQEWADFKVKSWRETSTAAARIGYMMMFVTTNILDKVKGLTTPLCVICTSDDAEGHRKGVMEQTFAKWFPHVEIHEIQNAGHYPMQETPVSFATIVNGFLRKQLIN